MMKLPVITRSYQPDAAAMVRAIHRAVMVLARTVTDEQDTPNGQAIICPNRPDVRAVNFAADVQLPSTVTTEDDASAWLGQLLKVFTDQQSTCHVLYPRQSQWAPPLTAAATRAGYEPVVRKVFALTNYQPPSSMNQAVQVVPARALYPKLPTFYEHQAQVEHHADASLASDLTATWMDFLDESRLELFIARIEGRNVASAGVLGLGQTGVIIPAWTDPSVRGQGVAATLMSHVMDACARALFNQVLLDRSTGCPAIGFYEALGFTQIDTFVKYRLTQQPPSHRTP